MKKMILIYKLVVVQLLVFILFTPLRSNAQDTLWQHVPLEFNANPRVMYYDSIDDVSYIAGNFNTVNGNACNVVMWDGINFTMLPLSPLHTVNTILRYRGNIYFGGTSNYDSSGLAYWNGSEWTDLDTMSPNASMSINCLYEFEDKLYVAGRFDNVNNKDFYVGVWNDTAWNSLLSIDTVPMNMGVGAAAVVNYKGHFYVAGDYGYHDYDSTVVCRLIMHDGTRWKAVKGNDSFSGHYSNYWINKFLVWEDTLYIAGFFEEKVYHNPGNAIVKWDGVNFKRLSNGLTTFFRGNYTAHTHAYDIKLINNELYVCGQFNNVDGILNDDPILDGTGIAKWNGEQWCTMGTKLNYTPIGIGAFRDSLYLLLGLFNVNINDHPQPFDYIAKWVGGSYTDTCATPNLNSINPLQEPPNLVSIYPNPNNGSFTLNINNLKTKGELNIYDITGRVVHTVAINNQEQQIVINGISKGLYIGRIVSKENVAVFKFRVE